MVRIKSILAVLTVCIALVGYLPLQPYLDPFARWFFPVALAVGLALQARGRTLPARVLTPLSLLLFAYFASGFTMDRLIVVTADLLVVFSGIRMLGERSGRNTLQLFGLSLFSLAASSLYNLSALFLVYLLLLLLLLAVSLVILTFHAQDPQLALGRGELRKVLAVSALMPAVSVPVMLLLFVLLPRTQYPLWDFLNRSPAKSTGFSDKVNPGGASSVSEVKNVVLRVVCPKLPEQRLYWRGIVLNGFSGNAWVRLASPKEGTLPPAKGLRVHQEIYPEPSRNPYLLALNIPVSLSGLRWQGAGDRVFTLQRPLDRRVRYEADSILADAIGVRGEIDREFYLRLPQTLSGRVRAEARRLARPGLRVEEKLLLLERFYRGQRIAYANVGLPTGPDPVDSFLFVKRRGNCEFFASSCATLLRLAGVPARLVGGYRGGNYSDMGGYYQVTEDMAHVWVEAYQEGRGWVTVDPSAWSIGFQRGGGAARKLRMYADALGFYWNKAVISYDLEKQLALVSTAGSKARNFRLPARWWQPLLWLAVASLPLAALWGVHLRRSRSREQRVLAGFLRAVQKRYRREGIERIGLFQLSREVDDPRLREFVALYGEALYTDRRLGNEEWARLRSLVREMAPPWWHRPHERHPS